MEIGVTGSGRLQRPDRLAGISEASNSIGAVALIQLKVASLPPEIPFLASDSRMQEL